MADLPTEDWYASQSKKLKLPHHCPIASITGCPRYFASLDHALRARVLDGEVPGHVRTHLLERWGSDNAFVLDDLQVSTTYAPNGMLVGVGNFCPEVSGLVNGLYCSDFRVDADDGSAFAFLHSKHFADCAEFAALGYKEKELTPVDRGVTPEKRFAVFKRDGFKCVYCGRGAGDVLLHVDHKVSRNDGGGDEIDNLGTACSLCNNGKGSESSI